MRKSTRIVKRLLALFLVVLMSIESFGAVVSDNDGSAFITKAEFDSLKNNFQSQIDQYNTSIDSKIDGAIAAYLAGVKAEEANLLNFPLGQNNYASADTISMTEGLMGVQFFGTQYVKMGSGRSGNNAGLNGYYRCNILASPAYGILLDTRCDGLNHKGGLYLGTGEVLHTTSYYRVSEHVSGQNSASAINGRSRRWALNWWNGDGGRFDSADIRDEHTYYNYFCSDFDDSNVMEWRPILLGVQDSTNFIVGSADRPSIGASTRKYDIQNNSLTMFNDQVLNNCIDVNYVNGLARSAVDNSTGTLSVGLWAVANQPDVYFNTSNSNNVYYSLQVTYGWSGVANYVAWLSVNRWNEVVQDGSYYKFYNGKNHLMFTSYISEPRAIYTDKYTSSHFNTWLRSQDSNLWLDYNGNTYFNLRYGNLLYDNEKTAGKYQLKVRNDSNNQIGFKILTNLSTTNFNQAQGIITDKGDTTAKNKIDIGPNSDITINFEIEDDVPVFFKCSDGAKISLISMTQTVET